VRIFRAFIDPLVYSFPNHPFRNTGNLVYCKGQITELSRNNTECQLTKRAHTCEYFKCVCCGIPTIQRELIVITEVLHAMTSYSGTTIMVFFASRINLNQIVNSGTFCLPCLCNKFRRKRDHSIISDAFFIFVLALAIASCVLTFLLRSANAHVVRRPSHEYYACK
jgi:hypothetical protein